MFVLFCCVLDGDQQKKSIGDITNIPCDLIRFEDDEEDEDEREDKKIQTIDKQRYSRNHNSQEEIAKKQSTPETTGKTSKNAIFNNSDFKNRLDIIESCNLEDPEVQKGSSSRRVIQAIITQDISKYYGPQFNHSLINLDSSSNTSRNLVTAPNNQALGASYIGIVVQNNEELHSEMVDLTNPVGGGAIATNPGKMKFKDRFEKLSVNQIDLDLAALAEKDQQKEATESHERNQEDKQSHQDCQNPSSRNNRRNSGDQSNRQNQKDQYSLVDRRNDELRNNEILSRNNSNNVDATNAINITLNLQHSSSGIAANDNNTHHRGEGGSCVSIVESEMKMQVHSQNEQSRPLRVFNSNNNSNNVVPGRRLPSMQNPQQQQELLPPQNDQQQDEDAEAEQLEELMQFSDEEWKDARGLFLRTLLIQSEVAVANLLAAISLFFQATRQKFFLLLSIPLCLAVLFRAFLFYLKLKQQQQSHTRGGEQHTLA